MSQRQSDSPNGETWPFPNPAHTCARENGKDFNVVGLSRVVMKSRDIPVERQQHLVRPIPAFRQNNEVTSCSRTASSSSVPRSFFPRFQNRNLLVTDVFQPNLSGRRLDIDGRGGLDALSQRVLLDLARRGARHGAEDHAFGALVVREVRAAMGD